MSKHDSFSHHLNYDRITDYIFIGSSVCCQTHFEEKLLKKGVSANISLETKPGNIAIGVDVFLWLPTLNNLPPSFHAMSAGVSLLKDLERQRLTTYVNCSLGHGRAPTLVAGYLITEKGMPAEEAMRFIKEKRHAVHFEQAQIDALVKIELQK